MSLHQNLDMKQDKDDNNYNDVAEPGNISLNEAIVLHFGGNLDLAEAWLPSVGYNLNIPLCQRRANSYSLKLLSL